ncbi:phage replisome organizer N-terminal domain-containing protein [Salinicoccus sesuvii]|uniref:Phage replisome organizer N-terminal domain-containing protein n=1 Tax=Salinicoccus sesuvii TaxID=868281 RepID=A0ABV7N6A6_9STAP
MADIQWIKLKVDMFDNEKIKLIEAMPDADSILVIWIKLLTYAGKANSSGYIMLTENIPMNEEELATIFGRPLNTVRYALQVFERYGMVERDADAIKIKNWDTHQNVDGMEKIREQNRIRKQKQREKDRQKQLGNSKTDGQVTGQSQKSRDSHATEEEKEREEELDKERDKEKERDKDHVSPSHNQEVFDILSDRGINMNKSQACFSISQRMSGIDDIQYLHEAIDIAERNGAKTAPYLLSIIDNWMSEGKDTYQKLSEHQARKKNGKKPLTDEQKELEKKLGF